MRNRKIKPLLSMCVIGFDVTGLEKSKKLNYKTNFGPSRKLMHKVVKRIFIRNALDFFCTANFFEAYLST